MRQEKRKIYIKKIEYIFDKKKNIIIFKKEVSCHFFIFPPKIILVYESQKPEAAVIHPIMVNWRVSTE